MITEEMQEILDLQQKLNEKIERLMPLNNHSSRIKEIKSKVDSFIDEGDNPGFVSDYVYKELKEIDADKLDKYLDDNSLYTRNKMILKIFKEGTRTPISGDSFYIDDNEELENILMSKEFSIYDENASPLLSSEVRRLINYFEDEDLPF